jgi:hypothetical protein
VRINYINLTNGIEAIPKLDNYRFIRIQSTICEQKNWDRLIQELDYDFLLNVAVGNECCIYDYGTRKPVSRAVYQGLEFIKYALYRRWLNEEYQTNCCRCKNKEEHSCQNANKYFESCYVGLDKRTKKKLDYFKPFVSGEINLTAVTDSTMHDGDKGYYKEILFEKNHHIKEIEL